MAFFHLHTPAGIMSPQLNNSVVGRVPETDDGCAAGATGGSLRHFIARRGTSLPHPP